MRQLARYAFANARVRALLSQLLDEAAWRRLLEARDLQEVLSLLQSTPYGRILASFTGVKEELVGLERTLKRQDIALHRKLARSVSGEKEKSLILLLCQRYEVEELKTALRLWHGKPAVEPERYLLGETILAPIDFSQVVTARSLEEIIVLLDETDYKLPLIKARLRFQETGSLFFLEASLDLDYYRRLVEATRHLSSMDRQIARVLIGLEIDQENINWLVRQRLYYSLGLEQFLEWVIPGGCHISQESIRASYVADGHQHIMEALARGPYQALKKFSGEDFHLMERFLHEVLLHQVKKTLAGFPFTIGTLLGYLILKKRETKLLLSLCYGKAAGLSQPDIERLIVP